MPWREVDSGHALGAGSDGRSLRRRHEAAQQEQKAQAQRKQLFWHKNLPLHVLFSDKERMPGEKTYACPSHAGTKSLPVSVSIGGSLKTEKEIFDRKPVAK